MKSSHEPLISISLGRRHVVFSAVFVTILLAIGYAIAIGSGDFNVHGHDTGEMAACPDGKMLKTSSGAWACSDDYTGASRCETLRPYNPAEGIGYTGFEVLSVPSYCMSGQPCYIIIKHYDNGGNIIGMGAASYLQAPSGSWMSEGTQGGLGGKNGDTGLNRIATSGTFLINIYDDWTGVDTDPSKWTYNDAVGTNAGEVVVCRF